MKVSDQLPQFICTLCSEKVHHCYKFRIQCQNSEKVLLENIGQCSDIVEDSILENDNDSIKNYSGECYDNDINEQR